MDVCHVMLPWYVGSLHRYHGLQRSKHPEVVCDGFPVTARTEPLHHRQMGQNVVSSSAKLVPLLTRYSARD
jgi:hypothetical protein